MKYITLNRDNNYLFSANIEKFLSPKYIYIYVPNNFNIIVKNKENVLKDQVVAQNNIGNIYATVSGQIAGIKQIDDKKYLVIANDYKEKQFNKKVNKDLSKIGLDDFKKNIFEKKVLLAGHYDTTLGTLFNKKIKNIVINGIEDEPYIAGKQFLVKNHKEDILEIANYLFSILKLNQVKLALSIFDRENIELYELDKGQYPNIEINPIPGFYLLGHSQYLTEYLELEEKDTLVIEPIDLLMIYSIIKYNRLLTETYFTINGDYSKKRHVYYAKIGASTLEINNTKLNEKNICYLNGMMKGKITDYSKIIIERDTRGLIINASKDIKEEKCIRCGKCIEFCPVKLNPLKEKNSKKCINCGLCSYVCPAYIDFKNKKGDNEL